ncbi:MAG: hypothetical protein JNJ83_18975 [Verrucomicrobiaceae bacterium]|nr:hypothetical protein [Verrucomicrobiaceae bacterium]
MASPAPIPPLPPKRIETLGQAIHSLTRAVGDVIQAHAKRARESHLVEAWRSLGSPSLRQLADGMPLDLELCRSDARLTVRNVTFAGIGDSSAWDVARWALHLPSLKTQLSAQLRLARYMRLRHLLPMVLFKPSEAQNPPPGAVIAGVDAASWSCEKIGKFHPVSETALGVWLEPTLPKGDDCWTISYERSPRTGRIELARFTPQG